MVWNKKKESKIFNENLNLSIFMQKRISELTKEIKRIDTEINTLKTMKAKLQQDIIDYKSEKFRLGLDLKTKPTRKYNLKGFKNGNS